MQERTGPLCLVDYPNHANVGDSAIWLGEIAYLSRTLGVQPAYCCSRPTTRLRNSRKPLPKAQFCSTAAATSELCGRRIRNSASS
jgi:hypothetical protein